MENKVIQIDLKLLHMQLYLHLKLGLSNRTFPGCQKHQTIHRAAYGSEKKQQHLLKSGSKLWLVYTNPQAFILTWLFLVSERSRRYQGGRAPINQECQRGEPVCSHVQPNSVYTDIPRGTYTDTKIYKPSF